MRNFAIIMCSIIVLTGLVMLSVVPPAPLSEPEGVAYASLFLMVVCGAGYGLIICAPYSRD